MNNQVICFLGEFDMKSKNILLGFLTAGTMATFNAPKVYADETDKDATTVYAEKKQDFYDVVKDKFQKINPKTAKQEASQTMFEAEAMLSISDSTFYEYSKLLHDETEAEKIHAARIMAYTIQKGDSEKLRELKAQAKKVYDDCIKTLNRLNLRYNELNDYITKNSEAASEATDSVITDKTLLDKDPKLLKLQLDYANAMQDYVEIDGRLKELDVPLRIAQLNQDIYKKQIELQKVKNNIKEWDKKQKEIDKLEAELKALSPNEFDNEAKQKLTSDTKENNKISSENLETAQDNWNNYQYAKNLGKKIDGYKAQQLELGASRDTLVSTQGLLESEIQGYKIELKTLKKQNNEAEINLFTKEEYETSFKPAVDDFAKAYANLQNSKKQVAGNDTISEYEAKLLQYREKASSVESDTLEGGTVQTKFIMDNNGQTDEVMTIKYPNGRSVIMEGKKAKVVFSYDKNGKLDKTYRYNSQSDSYIDDKGGKHGIVSIWTNAGIGR